MGKSLMSRIVSFWMQISVLFDIFVVAIKIKECFQTVIPPLPEYTNFCTLAVGKVYTDEGGIKELYHSVSTCSRDYPLTTACRLSACTGGQTMV